MALSLHTNRPSLSAQTHLMKSNKSLAVSMQRLGSGLRINSAADDAAGLQMATRLRSQSLGHKQGMRNAQNAISMLETAEGAMDEMNNIVLRMKDLSIAAATGVISDADRNALDREFAELRDELTNITSNTTFGGENLFDKTAGKMTNGGITFQIGGTTDERMTVDVEDDVKKVVGGIPYTPAEQLVKDRIDAAGGFDAALDAYQAGPEAAEVNTAVATQATASNEQSLAQTKYNAAVTSVNQAQAAYDASKANYDNNYATADAAGQAALQADLDAKQADLDAQKAARDTQKADLDAKKAALNAAKVAVTAAQEKYNNNLVELQNGLRVGRGLDSLGIQEGLTSQIAAQVVMDEVDDFLEDIGTVRSAFGANINRLEHTISNLSNMKENTDMAHGRIMDADIAAETTNRTKQEMLMQSGINVLIGSNNISHWYSALLR
ncbi:MAG: flagellin [Aeromonas sp.]